MDSALYACLICELKMSFLRLGIRSYSRGLNPEWSEASLANEY
jgi:hypothetical protein